uniref:Uncharacterized protein n=2 Tax=Kalmanozyma brasiliensis (strain GHG001) TaxID=1365824 RepID=V5GNL6_KALBG
MQQEQFLRAGKEGRLSRYEGLIDTWDKNGLPLSRSDVMAMQKAKKLQEEEEKQQQRLVEEAEEDLLTPGPAPALQAGSSALSPTTDTALGERSRSRASSRRSQRDHHQQLPQQEVIPMQTFQPAQEQEQAAHVSTSDSQPQAVAARQHDNDKVDKSACCCIVM